MRGTSPWFTPVWVAAVLVAGGIAGCSEGSGGGGSPAASSGASSTASVSTGATVSPVEAPAGTTLVQATSSGLQFAVPETWTVLDPGTLATEPDSATAKALEKTYGVSADQLSNVFGAMDLVVLGPAEKSFTPNVNVVPNPLTALPKARELAAELEKMGAAPGPPRDATTPLGPAIVVPYDLKSGSNLIKGRSIVLEGPTGYVTITVSDLDAKSADSVSDDILATASPAP